MTSAPTLGPVVFNGFEVPERISIGGRQKLVVHMLPGGGRIVDAIGPDDAPVRWSGIFSGPNAAERVRVLDGLRRSGSQLQFVWDAWRYQVIIETFSAEVENANWIPYQIELCVLPQSQSLITDWLSAAIAPALTISTLTGAALGLQISASGSALMSGSLAQLTAASGQLAQYVTSWAYSGRSE